MLLHRDALQSVLSFLVPEGDLLLSARRVSHAWRSAAALEHSAGFRRRHAEQKQLSADAEDPAELLRLIEAAEPTSATIHRVRLLSRQHPSPLLHSSLIRLLASSPSRKLQLELVCLPRIHSPASQYYDASVLREHAAAVLSILMRLIEERDRSVHLCAVQMVSNISIQRCPTAKEGVAACYSLTHSTLCVRASLQLRLIVEQCPLDTADDRAMLLRSGILGSLGPIFADGRASFATHYSISKVLELTCEVLSLDEDVEMAAVCLPVLTDLMRMDVYVDPLDSITRGLWHVMSKIQPASVAPLVSDELLLKLVDLLTDEDAAVIHNIPWAALLCVQYLAREPALLKKMMDRDLLSVLVSKADPTQDENTRNFAMHALYHAADHFPEAVIASGAIPSVLQFISSVWQTDGYAVCAVARLFAYLDDSRERLRDLVHSDGAVTALCTTLTQEPGQEPDVVIRDTLDALVDLMLCASWHDDFHQLLEPSLDHIREMADGDREFDDEHRIQIERLARTLLERYEYLA